MALPVYCTVEDVKRALDNKETARNDAQLWRAVNTAARGIERDCNRWFYPSTRTAYFEWPSRAYPTPWRLWLDENEMTAVTAVTAGGVAIPIGNVYLEPVNTGPPYTHLEINRSTSSGFSSGSTPQRAIAVTGTFGYCDDTETAGSLAAAVSTTSATTLTVTDSSLVGTGDTIKVDSERMLVTGRAMTTTSQTLQTPVTASTADVTLAVTTGSSYAVGEVLLLDSERMLVVDISANNLTVRRAYDGTVLAAHTGSTVYAPRLLTVSRGITGTTAATHLISAAVTRQTVPAPIRDLAIATASDQLLQEATGYTRSVSVGRGVAKAAATMGLNRLHDDVVVAYRRTRTGTV